MYYSIVRAIGIDGLWNLLWRFLGGNRKLC